MAKHTGARPSTLWSARGAASGPLPGLRTPEVLVGSLPSATGLGPWSKRASSRGKDRCSLGRAHCCMHLHSLFTWLWHCTLCNAGGGNVERAWWQSKLDLRRQPQQGAASSSEPPAGERGKGTEKSKERESQLAALLRASNFPSFGGEMTNLAVVVLDEKDGVCYIAGCRHSLDNGLGPSSVAPSFSQLARAGFCGSSPQ